MKRRTILTLIISIISLLGASTLVYNAMSPDTSNYDAKFNGDVQENTSATAFSIETTLSETLSEIFSEATLPPAAIVPGSTAAAPAQTTAPKAQTAPPAVTTAPTTAAQTQPVQTQPPAAKAAPAVTTTPPAKVAPKTGNAPDFTVYDASGNKVTLSSFAGKPVVINFWASWCGPCKAEMPDFQTMYTRYAGQGVAFLMINLTDGSRETKSSALSFLKTNNYTFPAYFDTQRSASTAYGISSIPSTFFISKEGDIQNRQIGQISPAALESGIKSIL